MRRPRADHTATLLANGRVLIAGGTSARNAPQPLAEIFDPVTLTFAKSGRLITPRSGHTATLLDDGVVVLIGGTTRDDRVLDQTEIFDPKTGMFVEGGALSIALPKIFGHNRLPAQAAGQPPEKQKRVRLLQAARASKAGSCNATGQSLSSSPLLERTA